MIPTRAAAEAKKSSAADFVLDLIEGGSKCLVFAHYLSVLDHLEERLSVARFPYIRIDGNDKLCIQHATPQTHHIPHIPHTPHPCRWQLHHL